MKSVIVLWFFIVIIFIVLGLGFAYVIQQQQVSGASFRAVEQKVASHDAAVEKLEVQLRADSQSIKTIQDTLTSGEAAKNGLSEKVDTLMRQVEEVKAQLGDVFKAKEAVLALPVVVAPAPVGTEPASVVAAPTESAPEETVPAVELGTIPVEKESL